MTIGSVHLSSSAILLKTLLRSMPLSEPQQETAAALIRDCTAKELEALGLECPPPPAVPKNLAKLGMPDKLRAVQDTRVDHIIKVSNYKWANVMQLPLATPMQRVIASLQYNHASGNHYSVRKARPFSRIMDTARDTLREGLPIKCIEAVFLGLFLTAGWEDLERIPVGFKSSAGGQIYRHIVLVVHHVPTKTYGALGISRRPELMNKELMYSSLSAVLEDYKGAYERWWHCLLKIRVGLPVEHDVHWGGPVCWRYCTVSPNKHAWPACAVILDTFSVHARRLAVKWHASGCAPKQSADVGITVTEEDVTPSNSAASSRCAQSVSPGRRRPPAATSTGTPPSGAASSRSTSTFRRPKGSLASEGMDPVSGSPQGSRPQGPGRRVRRSSDPGNTLGSPQDGKGGGGGEESGGVCSRGGEGGVKVGSDDDEDGGGAFDGAGSSSGSSSDDSGSSSDE